MQLIKIFKNNQGEQVVSAKDLFKFLNVSSDFLEWIKEKISEYELIENEDFTINYDDSKNIKDYFLMINIAKELAMVQNNSVSKMIRKYFINCEKKYKRELERQVEENQAAIYIFHNNCAVRKYAEEMSILINEIRKSGDCTESKLNKLKGLCQLLKAYAFPTEKDKVYGVSDNKYIY